MNASRELAPSLLPAIPQPPHDPTSWLLNARVGWQDASLTPRSTSAVFSFRPDRPRRADRAPGRCRAGGGLAWR